MKKRSFFTGVSILCLSCLFFAGQALCAQHDAPRYVYLTFDDGPLPGSEKINSIVLSDQIKINVFIVGKVMEQDKRLRNYFLLYQKNPYIDVYNHSFSHANNHYSQYYENPQGVLEDIVKNETEFHLPYKIVRLPGGNVWRLGGRKRDLGKDYTAAADLLAFKGYTVIGWDVEWKHSSKTGVPVQSVDTIVDQINSFFKKGKEFTRGHLVLLLHDEMFRKNWEKSELNQLVSKLKQQGYILEHLRQYPNVSAQ